MRVSVQGCLILLLCLVSLSVHARTKAEATTACQNYIQPLQGHPVYNYSCVDKPIAGNPSIVAVMSGNGSSTDQASWTYEPEDCVALNHEPDPITGAVGSTNTQDCSCAVGWVSTGGVPGENVYDCEIPDQQPEECSENGYLYDPNRNICVLECEHGMLNGACLPPPEPQQECTKESPDYRGQVVLGYGKPPINACGDFDQCSGDKPGQVGIFNGELRCISEEYGAPECKGESIMVIDDYGFACEPLTNVPETPDAPEDPNTDTDGDGQPDEYNPDNDPNINRKQLDKLNENQQKGNESLKNLEGIGKGINDRLDDIKQGVNDLVEMGRNGELAGGGGAGGNGEGLQDGEGNDYLEDIKQNTRDTADALEAPEGGLNTEGLGNAPEFGESATRLKNALFGHPTIQAVTTIPTIGTSTTCPTWTIPANDYWDALTLDVHCAILEDYRSTLSVLFLFFWTVVAIFLFLRA